MNKKALQWILFFISPLVAAVAMLVIFKNELPFFDIGYYVIVLLLAMSFAVFFQKILKDSNITAEGKAGNYMIKASGSTAIFFIILFGGYYAKPSPDKVEPYFNFIVNIFPKDNTIQDGSIEIIYNGFVPQKANVDNGRAVFEQMPFELKGKKVILHPQITGYENFTDSVVIPIKNNFINYFLKLKKDSTEIHGNVVDQNNRMVRHCKLDFESGLVITYTDASGNFRTMLPVKEATQLGLKIYVDDTVKRYDHLITISSLTSKDLMLDEK